MYDIRQFKPMLYVLVLMGMVGYALAALSPGFFVFPVALVLLNAWLIKTGRFAPMPRWFANIATLICFIWAGMHVIGPRSTAILVIGQFLVILQLVKLYEQRANRDYAQLLILSLLLMVASAISTASLLFGILLIVYLFVSLYCCLLFHLKVDTEHARSAMALPDHPHSELTLRQDQRNLSKSMRRLTGLVSSVSVVTAVVVFLFFPRGMGAGLLGPLQFRPAESLTGFSEQVSFQRIAAITQSQEMVGYVKLYKDDQPIKGTQPLLLRGLTLDVYNGDDTDGTPWQWTRSPSLQWTQKFNRTPSGWLESRNPPGDGAPVWRQDIHLLPTGTPVLFAVQGAYALMTRHDTGVRQYVRDEVLHSTEPLNVPIDYTVLSRGYILRDNEKSIGRRRFAQLFVPNENQEEPERPDPQNTRSRWQSHIDPTLAEYARRDEVSGGLAARRPAGSGPHEVDADIARAIEKHLQSTFKYSLDLTDSKRLNGQDPMAWFLSEQGRRGHCEYFAGAMTLMCQSLGMRARMVIGFKCDEYNDFSQQYQVRQSHAHAWVEVETPTGWVTYDPTSGNQELASTAASAWQKLKHMFNFLEFSWAKNVVAYDNDNRENLVANLNRQLTNSAAQGNSMFQSMRDWLDTGGVWIVSSKVLSGFMGLMALLMVASVIYFAVEKYRLRRRAARIGLDTLPASDQLKLARQLGFYDDLIRLLEKHQIARPKHLTPLEFSESLDYLPSEVFLTIRRLTNIFYEIRYGRRELSVPRQKRLYTVISRLQQFMPTPAGSRPGA